MTVIPVKVAVRCRPLVQKEEDDGNLVCVHFPSNAPMIVVGKKPFTFNYVFPPEVGQEAVYEETVHPLVGNIIKGYNATVLAYGQTGSGKTYTMGGAYSGVDIDAVTGIIPRILGDLFVSFAEKDTHEFNVSVSYLEIYNEEVRDLLNMNNKDPLNVREDASGIKIPGLKEIPVTDYNSTMKCLETGVMTRTVGATAMNLVSSRSHAIFTLYVDITNKKDENECYKSKLHLVDLAGSERIKKTLAEGSRLKEGININKGLLCLGNVISALGEDSKHIPYRDSKLTRLLQDSLGGNSYTLMIACISPADSNMEETLNTLRYADRASKIKNKPLVNHDPKVAEIINLKNQLTQLQMDLLSVTGGKTETAYKELKERAEELERQNNDLTKELHVSLERNTQQWEQIMQLESCCEKQKSHLESLLELCGKLTEKENEEVAPLKENYESIKNAIECYTLAKPVFEESSIEEPLEHSGLETTTTPDSQQLNVQHTLKQAAMTRELDEINCILAKKEQLAKQITQTNLEELRSQYEADKKELEKKITSLLEEKESLQSALTSVKSSKVEKVSEKRRQKLKELEQKVAQLKKEMMDKERTLKSKENSEKQVTNLNVEIQNLKSQRVKLMKRMKEETDSFRKWKLKKDHEVNSLLQKDRKRQFEIEKLKRSHEKQQAILKRKSEEACAANKRLKEAMNKQKAVRSERQHQLDNYGASKNAQSLKVMVEREIDVKASLQETKHYLKTLIEQRVLLNSQVNKLGERLKGPPKKRKAIGSSPSAGNSFNITEIGEQIKQLKEDIKIRNIQITEMQYKIQDAEHDKSKSCWEMLHSMNEAKVVMKSLFEKTVTEKAKGLIMAGEMKELQQGKDDAEKSLKRKFSEVENIAKVFQNEKTEIEQKYENRILRILKKFRSVTNEDLNVTIDEGTRSRAEEQESYEQIIETLEKRISAQEQEINNLRKEADDGLDTPELFDTESSDNDCDWVTPYVKKARKILEPKCCCLKTHCIIGRCGCIRNKRQCSSTCHCEGKCGNGVRNSTSESSSEDECVFTPKHDVTSSTSKSLFQPIE